MMVVYRRWFCEFCDEGMYPYAAEQAEIEQYAYMTQLHTEASESHWIVPGTWSLD